MERWSPPVEPSETEKRLLKLAGRSRKLFVFLREHRHKLFDDAFQAELEMLYRATGKGEAAQPPALMCMAFHATSLGLQPMRRRRRWFADGDNLYHSTDSGVSWTKLTSIAFVTS